MYLLANLAAPEDTMPFEYAAAQSDVHPDPNAAGEDRRLRREFWSKARRVAGNLPFAEDLLAAYYCAFDQATPLQVKAALVGALAYFVLPFDAVPDMLPLLGFGDDAAILMTALTMVGAHIRPEHREAARNALAAGMDDEQ
jgi:uncharacterized membrane protein YkvA (DUF1232 family)